MDSKEYWRYHTSKLNSVNANPALIALKEGGCLTEVVQEAYNDFVRSYINGGDVRPEEFLAIVKIAAKISGNNTVDNLQINIIQPFVSGKRGNLPDTDGDKTYASARQ